MPQPSRGIGEPTPPAAPVGEPLAFTWAGEDWLACAERALVRLSLRQLIITDPHFGKEASFRQQGIPIPDGSTQADLDRLSRLIDQHAPACLTILGDFFHNRASRSPEVLSALGAWRSRHRAIECHLVRGNHDRHAGDPPPELDLMVHPSPWVWQGIEWRHHPAEAPGPGPSVAGHVHPVVRLPMGGASARLPVFWAAGNRMVLPAFGSFTGGGECTPLSGDLVLGIAGNRVLDLSRAVAALRGST